MPAGRALCWSTEEQATYWPCIVRNQSAGEVAVMTYLNTYIRTGIGHQSYSDWYRAQNPTMCRDYHPAQPPAGTLFIPIERVMGPFLAQHGASGGTQTTGANDQTDPRSQARTELSSGAGQTPAAAQQPDLSSPAGSGSTSSSSGGSSNHRGRTGGTTAGQ